MLDLKRTLRLVLGAFFDAETTWRSYLAEAGDWKKTALLLTAPLIVASALIAYVLGLIGSDSSLFGVGRPTIVSTLVTIVWGAIAIGLVAFIFGALSGVFGGKGSFALALAATSLAFVPAYAGQALVSLPWIGGLLALGLGIYGLVLLWRIIPIYLEVPGNKRVFHYVVSLLASLVALFVLSSAVGRQLYGSLPNSTVTRQSLPASSGRGSGALFGDAGRQAELLAAAEEDRYSPPADGKLSDRQVQEFIRVMSRAAVIQTEKQKRLQEIAAKADKEEQMSFSDMSTMMSGMTEIAGLHTTEAEVVKSGGGNWAEHQWVRESLRTAWMQRDIDETVAHNYALYRKYEEQVADFIVR